MLNVPVILWVVPVGRDKSYCPICGKFVSVPYTNLSNTNTLYHERIVNKTLHQLGM